MNKIFSKIDFFFNHNWQIGILKPTSGCLTIEPDPAFIPYFKAQNAQKCHILLKPKKAVEAFFLLIDDVNWLTIKQQHQFQDGSWQPGRFVIETSPNNFQVWLRFSLALSLSKKLSLLKQYNSDPACYPKSRFGRCPGFRNTKSKHVNNDGGYPLAKLVWIDYAHYADTFPIMEAKVISRQNYDKNNESQTDFAYALALFRKGFSDQAIKARILAERSNWENHSSESKKLAYLDRTIVKAKTIIHG